MVISTYPYPPGDISKRQAVDLISAVVYPNDNPTAAKKRVRARIQYAREKGELSRSDSFSPSDFFRWALAENPDWANLAAVEGLPRAPTIVNLSASLIGLGSVSCKGHLVGVPSDPEKLREEFTRVEVERQKLTEKVAEQEKRIAELEAEVAGWRERDRQYREQRSKAGKNAWGNTRTRSRK